MFLNSNYILASELVEKMGIHIANISIIRNQLESENDICTIKKMGACTFINKNSGKLPQNIQDGIRVNTFTDMTDKIPTPFIKEEFNLSYKELSESGIILGEQKISGKKFYIFDQDFVEKVKDKICYVLSPEETQDCLKRKLIDGFIQINNRKCLTWYKVYK